MRAGPRMSFKVLAWPFNNLIISSVKAATVEFRAFHFDFKGSVERVVGTVCMDLNQFSFCSVGGEVKRRRRDAGREHTAAIHSGVRAVLLCICFTFRMRGSAPETLGVCAFQCRCRCGSQVQFLRYVSSLLLPCPCNPTKEIFNPTEDVFSVHGPFAILHLRYHLVNIRYFF